MSLIENWSQIRKLVNGTFRRQLHVAIASIDTDGKPTNTPIGSLFLNSNQTGFYFEKFPKKLPKNAQANPNICVLAINSKRLFWLKSLFKNKFDSLPGIKLHGVLGERRKATKIEISRLNKRMWFTKGLKGNTYLWGDMKEVRDITFTAVEKINIGEMTKGL